MKVIRTGPSLVTKIIKVGDGLLWDQYRIGVIPGCRPDTDSWYVEVFHRVTKTWIPVATWLSYEEASHRLKKVPGE